MPTSMLYLLFFALFLSSCAKNDTLSTTPLHPCVFQTFSKKLKKTVIEQINNGVGPNPAPKTVEYFFDAQGRVDSILTGKTPQKVVYGPDGKVDKVLDYWNNKPGKVSIVQQYTYKDGLVSKITANYIDPPLGLPPYQITRFFEWDSSHFLVKTWLEKGDDYTIFTNDDCGNILKTQNFYHKNGKEHLLIEERYDDTISPYFLIGLSEIFPGGVSVHNRIFEQIVYWDCADYDGTPLHSVYEYNSDGLPSKMSNRHETVHFYYE